MMNAAVNHISLKKKGENYTFYPKHYLIPYKKFGSNKINFSFDKLIKIYFQWMFLLKWQRESTNKNSLKWMMN